MSDEPLSPEEASQLTQRILAEGTIRFTRHALEEMENDGIKEEDIQRALRGGCEPAEWLNNQWRYRFHSYDVWAVTTFRDEEIIIVITAWRKRR